MPGYKMEMKEASKIPDDSMRQQAFTNIYFKYRGSEGGGDYISSSIARRALTEKFHIVWETTGDNISWTLKTIQEARLAGYMVFLVYPFVSETNLIMRVEKRASSGESLRKPDLQRIRRNIITAQNNFSKIIKYVDKAFVYNNDGGMQELSVMIEIEKTYKGYCKRANINDENLPENYRKFYQCKNGVELKTVCDTKALSKLKQKFTQTYQEYIDKICR